MVKEVFTVKDSILKWKRYKVHLCRMYEFIDSVTTLEEVKTREEATHGLKLHHEGTVIGICEKDMIPAKPSPDIYLTELDNYYLYSEDFGETHHLYTRGFYAALRKTFPINTLIWIKLTINHTEGEQQK